MLDEEETPNPFLDKAQLTFSDLFERARLKDELNFALSLSPEFKAYTLTSAIDAQRAYDEYGEFLQLKQFHGSPVRVRVALAFYCHVAEAAGLWGIPMCMLGILEGNFYNTDPFNFLVRMHKGTGQTIAPNANRVMGAMADCANSIGLFDLAEVFRDAFDTDLRNGFAHADYALSQEGVQVRGRHDRIRTIVWQELQRLLQNGIGLFQVLREVVGHYQRVYQEPRIVVGSINPEAALGRYLIYSDPIKRAMSVSGGPGWTEEMLLDAHRSQQME